MEERVIKKLSARSTRQFTAKFKRSATDRGSFVFLFLHYTRVSSTYDIVDEIGI